MKGEATRILLVEDNPGDARLIREMLAEAEGASFEIDWAPHLSAGLEKLSRGEIDLVLLDLGLPDSRGLDTFVKAYAQAPQIPFVVLSGLDDQNVALGAVREGAQDYLVKGKTDSGLLLRAIRYATERKRIEEELRLANEELRREIEERRAADMAVEAERQRLFALLDGLPAMVSLIAPDFSLLFGNRVFGELFGNWQGKRCYEAVFGKSEPCEGCPAVQVMENRALSVKEMTILNGRVFNIYKYPFTDVDGSALVLSLGIDITERKRAEEALEAERQRLYSLLDGLPGLVYLKAPDFSLKFANRLFREVCGEWEGKKCYEAIFNRESPCEHCTQFRVLETGKPSVKEATYAESNRIFQVYSYPFADVDGSSLVLTLGIDISERKQAEAALKESERKYRMLVKAIPAVVFKGYADWSIEFFDDKVEELTGYNREEFNSRRSKWSDLILEEDFEPTRQAFIQALKDDGAYLREYRIRTKEGHILWVQARGQIVFNPDGQINHVSGVFYDISERKEVEDALRQSEARLAKAQRLAHLGNWEWNIQTGEIIGSEEVYRICGLDPQKTTLTREASLDFVHPEDREQVKSCVKAALAGERPYNTVCRLIRPDGSVRYIHSQAEVSFDENGLPRRLLGTAQDITERRIAEMRLRDSEARFRAIFQGAAIGIVLSDLEGRIMAANVAQHKMLGYRDEKLRGKTFLEITHVEDRARNLELFDDLKKGLRDGYRLEKRFLRQDGSDLWAQVTVSLIRDLEGNPRCCVGTTEDITARKEAREKLWKSEENLRHLASQLFTAQEDERKRISRELHDELGQALLVLKLQTRAIEGDLQPGQQQLREECLEMLGNIDQVVDNVRRLSRDLSPTLLEDLGLSAALRHLITEFGKHYQIKYSLQETNIDDLFPLSTQIAIYRIIQESLTNIGKHSQANLLLVAITRHDDRVSFLIQDNGKGFDPAQPRRQSLGMGLAAMKERARMVGGVLSIWSQEGAGTKISLDIPYGANDIDHQKAYSSQPS